jgi:ABC-type phosphate transport system substrate-binding protein
MNKLLISALDLFLVSCLLLLINSCNQGNTDGKKPAEEVETMNSGKLTAYCDASLENIMSEPVEWYKKDYPKVKLTFQYANARNVMAHLLSGDARIIVLPRDYLRDEDSLMKVYKVKRHEKMPIAFDGLVFFTNRDFPLDTLNHSEILSVLRDGKALSSYYPKLKIEPELVINDINSSEYANLRKLVLKGDSLKKKLNFMKSADSVLDNVSRTYSIGIAYLSQVAKDTTLKLLKIGFIDSAGRRIRPKPVHQAYIVQDLYPYKVTIWAYLLEERRNLPFWFGKFLSIEEKVQRYFLDAGIVPAFARIKLIPEDE